MATQSDIATFELLINGSSFSQFYDVVSISVINELYRITSATIVLRDGSPAQQDFPLSDGTSFVPGTTIEIKAGFDNTNATIFKGIVTGQSVRCLAVETGAELVVEARDEAVRMTIARNNTYFTKQTDSAIMSKLIGNASGVSADVESTSYTWEELIQYYTTDWDFLLTRAEANGMWVVTNQNTVSVKSFKSASSSVTYTYGLDVYAFDAGMDARRQLANVSAQSWDYQTQSMLTASAAKPSMPSQGNLSAAQLASATAPSAFVLSTTAPIEQTPLTSWASAQLARSSYSTLKCMVKVLGTSSLLPGQVITLAGMGNRFNGDAFVSRVEQYIGNGNWYTVLHTGIDDNWFVDKVRATAPPASGLLPGVRGLVNGTVKAITKDPANETRVQVNIPVIQASGDGVWARLVNTYATSGTGYFWMPEIGDEVIVGFLNDDPGYPIILGSVYSSQKAPPLTPDDQNSIKAIFSKSKMNVTFDDQNVILTLQTPNANKIIFSDKDKSITIQDQNSNKIVMSSSGVAINSPKDISLTADGNVTINGTQGVTIKSTAGVDIQATQALSAKGLSVAISADTQLTAKGSASAEFSSSGICTIKGSMTMIN
jgi:Rhs element Vgr protein